MKLFIFFLICVIVFSLFPQIDIEVTSWFYKSDRFYLGQNWFFMLCYKGLYVVMGITIVSLLAFLIYQLITKKRFRYLNKKAIGYLFLALIVGPGIVTNSILKDHWDRARPHQIVQFGGEKEFTPFYKPSDQCERNCSFVSGHAAAAFFFLAFAFVFESRKIFYLALLFGILMSVTRVVQGGHFLSDVVFAFIINYFIFKVIYHIMYKQKAMF